MDTGLIGQPRLPRRETYLDGTPESSVPGLEQPPGNHDQEIVKRLEAGNVNQGLAAQFRLQHGSHESRFSTAAGAKQKQGFPVLDGVQQSLPLTQQTNYGQSGTHAIRHLPATDPPLSQKGSVGSLSGSIRGAIGGNFTESSYGYPP